MKFGHFSINVSVFFFCGPPSNFEENKALDKILKKLMVDTFLVAEKKGGHINRKVPKFEINFFI